MDSMLKKGLFVVTLTGVISMLPATVHAADAEQAVVSGTGIEKIVSGNSYDEVKGSLPAEEEGEYSDMAFADVDSFLYIRSEPTTQSEWVGKLYPDYAAEVIASMGDWLLVKSGNVAGYVYSDYVTVGEDAQIKAQQMIDAAGETEQEVFTYAESREEEEARLAAEAEEAAAREAAEVAALMSRGQEVVDYACQFVGNPYVWGGTSLTNGADCSGFVQSVFAHFGIDLPRTSSEMRSSGRSVSYEDALPGDIICYKGHVGIYMGDGQIVNAINSRKGIGYLSATYAGIVTVRRVL